MAPPRWKTLIEKALAAGEKSVVFQLATRDTSTDFPQVRSHIFRSFLSSESASAPMLLSTTDIRSPKVAQITENPWVQLVWWFENTQEQFRISGWAGVVPAATHALHEHFVRESVKAVPGSGLELLSKENLNWEERRKETFESMSRHMRASWCRPTPGDKLEGGYEASKKWSEKVDKDDREEWKLALSNFALLVVDPVQVDYVNLKVIPNKRVRFWRDADGWDGHEEELVP